MHSVTVQMVKSMVKKLKPNQCDEFCSIMSDCLIHGDDRLFLLLSFLYTIMIKHGYQSKTVNTVKLVPIPKDKRKSLSDSENFRAIAPNNIIMKL